MGDRLGIPGVVDIFVRQLHYFWTRDLLWIYTYTKQALITPHSYLTLKTESQPKFHIHVSNYYYKPLQYKFFSKAALIVYDHTTLKAPVLV